MRKPIIALAAAACLSMTACSPGVQTEDPASTNTVTSTVATSAPTMSASPMEESASPMTSSSPSATESTTAESSPPQTSPSTSQSAPAEATPENVDLASQTFAISARDAIDKAVEEAGGGFVHSIELDWSSDNNAWVYEIEVLDGNAELDIDINADSGVVVELDRDKTDDVEQAIDLESPMTWEEARDKALEAAQGRITSWKLEYDDNYTAWEFDIEDSSGDDVEVEINVDTGAVTIDD